MTTRFLLAVLAVGVALGPCGCTSAPTPSPTAPWGGLSSEGNHYLKDGGSITVTVDDADTLHIAAREGHLFMNDEDLGPCAPDQPIQFRADGRLVVDGETRARSPIE